MGVAVLALLIAGHGAAANLTAVPTDGSRSQGGAGSSAELRAEYPGQAVEAGETATFALRLASPGDDELSSRLTAVGGRGTEGWTFRFMEGESEVTRIALGVGASASFELVVETSGATPVGRYPIRVRAGDTDCQVEVEVTRSHAGETGTLTLGAVDEVGTRIRGVEIEIAAEDVSGATTVLMTGADGTISASLAEGIYRVRVGTNGYVPIDRTGVRIRAGGTTDLGRVTLEPAEFAAEVEIGSATVTTASGKNPSYDLTVRNRGRSDDTYRFVAADVPEGWYIRFKEDAASAEDLGELRIGAGKERALQVEAIPPHGVPAGEYAVGCRVDGSGGQYPVNLTARIRGSYDLRVEAGRYRYEIGKGEACEIELTLANTGTAGPLSNLRVNVSTPEGWSASVSPEVIGSLPQGESRAVTVRLVPPANIVASEYEISVSVEGDQADRTDEFRIAVREGSLVPLIGALVLVGAVGAVAFIFRRHRRR